jgi:hypothetical protein
MHVQVFMVALRRRLVHLDHVLEAEHAWPETGVQEQVVERRQEDRGGGQRAVELDAGLDDEGRTAVRDGPPLERPVGDEGVDVGPDARCASSQPPDRFGD